jgi:nucleotide-binding universal stress UspA family protein
MRFTDALALRAVQSLSERNDGSPAMTNATILICYDGTNEARRAIDCAARLLGPRRAIVLDVAPILTVSESLAMSVSVVPGNAFMELNEGDARTRAAEGTQVARRAGFEADPRIDVSEPTWQSIVDIADELNAAAIVMGTRALGDSRELFEGSVSHDVIRHAGRPVIVVPPARS